MCCLHIFEKWTKLQVDRFDGNQQDDQSIELVEAGSVVDNSLESQKYNSQEIRMRCQEREAAVFRGQVPVVAPEGVVIGITGITRSGKGWVSKGLAQAVEARGKKVTIVGQDEFWFKACQVTVRGQSRMSEEEPDCIDHEKFAMVIKETTNTHDVVIAEGVQLVYHPRVVAVLNHVFLLQLGKEEARLLRTQPRDAKLNPNPLKVEDFDDLLWPAHEQYMRDKVSPLGPRVVQLRTPENPAQRDELVQQIMHITGLKEPVPKSVT